MGGEGRGRQWPSDSDVSSDREPPPAPEARLGFEYLWMESYAPIPQSDHATSPYTHATASSASTASAGVGVGAAVLGLLHLRRLAARQHRHHRPPGPDDALLRLALGQRHQDLRRGTYHALYHAIIHLYVHHTDDRRRVPRRTPTPASTCRSIHPTRTNANAAATLQNTA